MHSKNSEFQHSWIGKELGPAALLICLSYSSLRTVFDLYWIQAHLIQLLLIHLIFAEDVLSGFRTWQATSTLDLYTPNTPSSPLNSIQVFRAGKDRSYLRQERISRNTAALQATTPFPRHHWSNITLSPNGIWALAQAGLAELLGQMQPCSKWEGMGGSWVTSRASGPSSPSDWSCHRPSASW